MSGPGGDAGRGAWPGPEASLDRIARLRVLAAGLPGCVVEETVFDGPIDDVWPRIADLERSVPAFDEDVRRLRVRSRRAAAAGPDEAERLRITSHQTWRGLWVPGSFDVDLAPGWCWMVSRPQAYVVGMAAEPIAGDRTRFALLEGVAVAVPGPLAPLRALLRPIEAVSHRRHRRHIPRDLAALHAYLAPPPPTPPPTPGPAPPAPGGAAGWVRTRTRPRPPRPRG